MPPSKTSSGSRPTGTNTTSDAQTTTNGATFQTPKTVKAVPVDHATKSSRAKGPSGTSTPAVTSKPAGPSAPSRTAPVNSAAIQKTNTGKAAPVKKDTNSPGTTSMSSTAVRKPAMGIAGRVDQTTRPSGTTAAISGGNKAQTTRAVQQKKFENPEDLAAEVVARLRIKAKESYVGKEKEEFRYGGPFLHNKEHIDGLRLFKVAQKAPKGAHLHIHLNACLGPEVLLDLAASKKLRNNMYISVNLQNTKNLETMIQMRKETGNSKLRNTFKEPLTEANIGAAKFQFHFLPYGWAHTCSLFSPNYHGRIGATDKAEHSSYDVMKFTDFLNEFGKYVKKDSGIDAYKGKHPKSCMNWLIKKLVFQKEDMDFEQRKTDKNDGEPKAIDRQWALFNARTQMMKGLFLAEHAYREYLKALFSSFSDDNIQYAELRPNFMTANSVICTSEGKIEIKNKPGEFWYDPSKMMNNEQIVAMIVNEFKAWKRTHQHATFKSMKIIMCTPRSHFPESEENIKKTLEECYRLKQKDEYKEWIAGFDFVGPELKGGRSLKDLEPRFNDWKERFHNVGLKWLLHCGESVYDKHGNIQYALDNLNPHRLAHGYAIQNLKLNDRTKAKLQRCCIETCPDSNENLGLAQDASCAAVYPLMKQNIPCSVSCDNPTLFNSTLSHEFYQVMVGSDNFSLKHWKKLMTDSIKYSVWKDDNDKTKLEVESEWKAQYLKFVNELVTSNEFKDIVDEIKNLKEIE